MGPGQHLHCLNLGRVAGQRPMVVPVGADQIGQHLGVSLIRFRSRHLVAVAVTTHRHRVDRIHLIPRSRQGIHPQATVCFDTHHHLGGVVSMSGHQGMEPTNAFQTLREATAHQPSPRLIHHIDVVVGLSPIITHKDHPEHSSRVDVHFPSLKGTRLRPNGSVLRRHDTP